MTVDYEREGPVAVATVDRAGRCNAVDRETADAPLDAWSRSQDGDAAVGILTGGDGTVSAGADLEAMDLTDNIEGWLGFTRTRVSSPPTPQSRATAGQAASRWASPSTARWPV